MRGLSVDGQDVLAVFEAVSDAVEHARSCGDPTLVETMTYRYNGHTGGPEVAPVYRSLDEVSMWRRRDPIDLLRTRLVDDELTTNEELQELEAQEASRIDDAWKFALDSPYPPVEETYMHMFSNPITVAT